MIGPRQVGSGVCASVDVLRRLVVLAIDRDPVELSGWGRIMVGFWKAGVQPFVIFRMGESGAFSYLL